MTALAAFFGTYLGFIGQGNARVNDGLLAITAGGFLYIATVSVLPVVMSHRDEAEGGPLGYLQMLLEAAGFASGVAFMVVVAFLE